MSQNDIFHNKISTCSCPDFSKLFFDETINSYNKVNFSIPYNSNQKEINYLIKTNEDKFEEENYKKCIYKEGDSYDMLIKKNKKLQKLFEKVNNELIYNINKQNEIEKQYDNEKKEILLRLEKIQTNYKMYADSHKKLQIFNGKIEDISDSYKNLLELYTKTSEQLKQNLNKYYNLYNSICDFVEKNYDDESINIISFEFLLHLRTKIKEDLTSPPISKYVHLNSSSENNKNIEKIENNNICKEIINRNNDENLNNINIKQIITENENIEEKIEKPHFNISNTQRNKKENLTLQNINNTLPKKDEKTIYCKKFINIKDCRKFIETSKSN